MIRRHFLFPAFKKKALTLSYDDGVRQDKRLISIMTKYGLKGTFNINAGLFSKEPSEIEKGRMTVDEAVALYQNPNVEVAAHGYKHLHLTDIDSAAATWDVIRDRVELESIFGKVIKGMAYAFGNYSDSVVDILEKCGVSYCRTTVSTEKFDIPYDWLRMPATCHHNNPRLMDLARAFADAVGQTPAQMKLPKLFYLWGHSYEFDNNDNWEVIEQFAEYIGGRDDIWYATNGEIYDYVEAYDRLKFSADMSYVHNPSAIDVYIVYADKEYVIPAGKSVKLA